MGILAPAPVRAMSVEIVTAYKSLYINDITIRPFPAGAGMNRCRRRSSPCSNSVPRRRGDEPERERYDPPGVRPFPAGAGMNLTHRPRNSSGFSRSPQARG